MSSIISTTKGDTILQFTENIYQLIYINCSFKSSNRLGLVAHTIIFPCHHRKKSNEVKSGERGGQESGPHLPIHLLKNS